MSVVELDIGYLISFQLLLAKKEPTSIELDVIHAKSM